MTKTCLAATLLAGIIAFCQSAAAQADVASLQREGNSLARSGLYHAALLRYREAAAAGADSPLYHYNVGIVYYRLGRLDDAIAELSLARIDAALDPVATYNIGLIELGRGDTAAAAGAFQRVLDMGAARPLRRSAREILDSLEAGTTAPAVVAAERTRPSRQGDEAEGGFRVTALARYAEDSNVYRSPSAAYVDQSDPVAPGVVTPVVHSASFMPVDLLASYVLPNEAGDTEFAFGYALNGDFYDAGFTNANRVSQRLSIGADIDMEAKEDRRRRLESSFFVRTHDETNFNPDDGLDRTLDGTDLADRFSYRGAGITASYLHERGRFLFGFDIDYERRQYEDAGLLPNYDHDYFQNYGFVDIEVGSRSEVGFGLTRFRRMYDERRARDLTGALAPGMGFVEYDYNGIDLRYRRQVGNALIAEIAIERLERSDLFVGYADYTQDGASVTLSYQPNRRIRIVAGLDSRQYDFPNAFAFNNPLAGPRELDTFGAGLEVEYALTDRLALWVQLELDEVTATDQREAYDRSLAMIGVKWRRR